MTTTSSSFGICLATLCLLSLAPAVPAQADEDRPKADQAGTERAAVGRGDAYKDLALASSLISNRKLREAEAILADLAEDIPESQAVWFQLALVRQLQGRTREAQPPARQAVGLREDDVNALLLAAEVFQATDPVQAKTWALRAGARASDNPAVLEKVIGLLLAMRDVDNALPLVAKALGDQPHNLRLLDLHARLALQAGKPRVAAQAYERILALKPRDPLTAESLAFTWCAAGDSEKAVQALQRLLQINPSNIKGRSKLIALMTGLGHDPGQIEVQRKYLAYYEWVARQNARKTARRQAMFGTARPGK